MEYMMFKITRCARKGRNILEYQNNKIYYAFMSSTRICARTQRAVTQRRAHRHEAGGHTSLSRSPHIPSIPFHPPPSCIVIIMLVLFETAAGFALFKVLDEGKLKQTDDLYKEFENPNKASKVYVTTNIFIFIYMLTICLNQFCLFYGYRY